MNEIDRATMLGRKTVWPGRGPFRVDEIAIRHEPAKGGSLETTYFSFERGDAVAALIVNRDTRQVILVDQFRAPIMGKGVVDGRIIEAAAGMVKQNETPEQCLQREIEEETGYQLQYDPETNTLKDVERIAEFYPSPGGCSERIFLYFVAVDAGTPRGPGGGVRGEGEFVTTVFLDLDDFLSKVELGEYHDPKLLIAASWLRDRMRNRDLPWRLQTKAGAVADFRIEGTSPPKTIGYRAGDIVHVTDVDVWVNSENTKFLMDRLYGESLSARIRTLGARTTADGGIAEDTIQDALKEALAIGSGLEAGNVIDTTSGALAKTHNVRRLIHASAVRADQGDDGVSKLTTDMPTIKQCATEALRRCDQLNRAWWRFRKYNSVILPIFGAGQARQGVEHVIEHLIPHTIELLRSAPSSKLSRIYFLAYTREEIEICDRVMSRHKSLQRV
jgi:nudix-type nucleoside diphosphatase (YffH/AdpP family)